MSAMTMRFERAMGDMAKVIGDIKNDVGALKEDMRVEKAKARQTESKVDELDGNTSEALESAYNAQQLIDTMDGVNIEVVRTGNHLQLKKFSYLAPFDLYDKISTKFKIRGGGAVPYSSELVIGGQVVTIGTGTAAFNTEITVSATRWVYVTMDRSTSTATLDIAASLPAGTDTIEYYALWYIPWDSTGGRINWYNIVDMRHSIHMEAMT